MIHFNAERVKILTETGQEILSDIIHKLNEECGEVSSEYLAYKARELYQITGASATAKGTPISIIDEACDAINSAMSIIYKVQEKHPNINDSLVTAIFEKKLDKWENKISILQDIPD